MLGQISATKPITPKWQHPNKPVERMTAVPAYDSAEDVSDWWQQETDPENEIGEAAEAFFLHNQECDNSFFGDGREYIESVELIALRIEDRSSVRIYTREGAAKYLGYGIVEQIEANHAEALNEH